MIRSAMLAALLTGLAPGLVTAAQARCSCTPRHLHTARMHDGGRHRMARHRLARSVVDARGLIGHAQWDVEVIPGRRLAPLDTDAYLPTPGEPGFEARVPVSLGYGGVVTPPLRLPVRRGYEGLK